ncbi:MAG TPA: SCP2 sterol-binding domain-containing protein [Gammaproteobacteria bacterium]|nr:SCP2 sterol-binding domain-containing protein [Gammaproteobacteria bacterium]
MGAEIKNVEGIVSFIEGKPVTDLQATLKIIMDDNQCVYVDGYSGKVSQEDKEADCTLILSLQDMSEILSGALNPTAAFMQGKLKIEGDMGIAMRLQSFFG